MNASFLSARFLPCGLLLGAGATEWLGYGGLIVSVSLGIAIVIAWLTIRCIPNDSVGIIEKLWSTNGGVKDGAIIALNGEAGYQADILRGGVHFGFWRWQYRVHRTRLVTVPQGKIGYVYARDGEPLAPSQTLGYVTPCNNFQDARAFLAPPGEPGKKVQRGQRGRQRAILREGVYALNTAVFVVITENAVYSLRRLQSRQESESIASWHEELKAMDGFNPVLVGKPMSTTDSIQPDVEHLVDSIGIVTVHDGQSLSPGEIIAPTVGSEPGDTHYHNNFQDIEAFLAAGGRRGRQHQTLTDGTYFINRWFATIQYIPKTVVPIGYVGVVVAYYGRTGRDLSGDAFRHGERVAEGERGVWERPFGPGKYAFNTYSGSIVLVPTTNFVLHWITGKSESHRYDESLRSIDLVTRDAYEPSLPLSVVVHIDYMRAPSVIQRFGDVKRLITQTLDPMLSAYFRDIAHRRTMLELLHERDSIQREGREELLRKFREFDIECVDVLIGKPTTGQEGGKIESLLEQLRLRQLSVEQIETYEKQRGAAEKLRTLSEAQALAEIQPKLTIARAQAQVAESQGEADLARARKQAEQTVVQAEAELQRARREAQQTVMLAEAESQKQILTGRGLGQKAMQIGLAEAAVLMRKVGSYGDPRLYALSRIGELLSDSKQPLVPERVFVAGSNGDGNHLSPTNGLVGTLLSLMVAEKSGFQLGDQTELAELKKLTDRLTNSAIQGMESDTSPKAEVMPVPEAAA